MFIGALPKEARKGLSVEIVIPRLSGRRHRSPMAFPKALSPMDYGFMPRNLPPDF